MAKPIGKIFGKTSTHGFRFKIENPVNKWDYIMVGHPEVGRVLSQVTEIEKTSGAAVADCIVIGYRTERGFLRKPKTPLEPGTEVFHVDDEFIKITVGLKENGLYLGLLEGKDKLKTFLDPKKLITKHLAVLAKSGSGKSYAVGVLLEELLLFGVPVMVLDPHGEYSSIRYENDHKEDLKYLKSYGLSPKGFTKQVKEYAINTQINLEAYQLKLPIPNNPFDLVENMPFKVSSAQRGLMYNVANDLLERKGKFNFEQLIKELEFNESNAKWRLIGGLQALDRTGLFSFSPTSVQELVKPGQLTILNFKGAPIELQEIVARSLLSILFEQRKLENIPPFFLVIEEAHNYCPERGFGEARSSKIVRSIASEGRKFGLGLGIVSQRPARVDKNVLSQCTNQIVLQVTNPNDLSAISKSFEGITSESEKEIKNLPIGKAMVIGSTDFPIFADIRVRRSQHGGRTKTFDLSEPTREFSDEAPGKNMMYLFEPRISRKEVETLEENKVDSISFVLRPCLSVNCSRGASNFHLLFDLVEYQLFVMRENLEAIKVPINIASLSPVQRKVLEVVATQGSATSSEIFVKSGLGFSEVGSVINSLARAGLVRINGKMVSSATSSLNLARLNFLDKPKFIESVKADVMSPKIDEQKLMDFIKALGVQVAAKKRVYLPFYKIKSNNEEKIMDAMSYSLRIG